MVRGARALAVLTCVGLIAASCGSDSKSATTTVAATTTAAPTTIAAATTAAPTTEGAKTTAAAETTQAEAADTTEGGTSPDSTGGGADTTAATGANGLPSYYPSDYDAMIEASKSEGPLIVYSTLAAEAFQPGIEEFNKLYPWMKVETQDLGSTEVFERYYAESASNAQSADVIVTSAAEGWSEYVKRDAALDYASPEIDHLPDWSTTTKNVYVLSTDPFGIFYNKALLDEDEIPHSLDDIAKLVTEKPDKFKGHITTHPTESVYSMWHEVDKHLGDYFWSRFEDTIGPATKPERSSGTMREKMLSGEYLVAYYASIAAFYQDPSIGQGLLDFGLMSDGQVMLRRSMSIPKGAKNVNSAKLFVDFFLSAAGQKTVPSMGLVPYREDVDSDIEASGAPTYDSLIADIGQDNVISPVADESLIDDYDTLVARWQGAIGG
jgi:iron(III) transport system substrate-binding protein